MKYYQEPLDVALQPDQVTYSNYFLPTLDDVKKCIDAIYAINRIGGSGTSGTIPKVSISSPYSLTDSVIVQDTTNVGIGTYVEGKLSIAGDTKFTGDVYFLDGPTLTPINWKDYSSTTLYNGWVDPIIKGVVFYKLVGKTCFCSFYISGTANTANSWFYLPFRAALDSCIAGHSYNNDENDGESLGLIELSNEVSDLKIKIHYSTSSEIWNSLYPHTKTTSGTFQYEIE
jgi:hypothetical protein